MQGPDISHKLSSLEEDARLPGKIEETLDSSSLCLVMALKTVKLTVYSFILTTATVADFLIWQYWQC